MMILMHTMVIVKKEKNMKNKLFKILCIASVSMLVLTGCKSVIPNILTEQNSEVLSEKISAAVEDQSQETFETELSTEEQSSEQKDEITAEFLVNNIRNIKIDYADVETKLSLSIKDPKTNELHKSVIDTKMKTDKEWAYSTTSMNLEGQTINSEQWIDYINHKTYTKMPNISDWMEQDIDEEIAFTGIDSTLTYDVLSDVILTEEDNYYKVSGKLTSGNIKDVLQKQGKDPGADVNFNAEIWFVKDTYILEYIKYTAEDNTKIDGMEVEEYYIECIYNELATDKTLPPPDFS